MLGRLGGHASCDRKPRWQTASGTAMAFNPLMCGFSLGLDETAIVHLPCVSTNEPKMNSVIANRMKKTTRKNTVSVPPVVPPTASVPAAKPVAPAKAVTATKSPTRTAATPITIEAKVDIGFGNNLFVRGQGAGLSWERGLPLENVDSWTWRLTVPAKDKVQFKLLINDTVWAQGDDLVAAPGKKVEVTPAF